MANPDPSLTPEKKLLKIIEGDSSQGGGTAVKAPPQGFSLKTLFSPSAWKGRMAYAKERMGDNKNKQSSKSLDLKQINKMVKLVTLGACVVLLGAMAFDILMIEKKAEMAKQPEPKPMTESPIPQGRATDVDLFNSPDKRNVFVPFVKKDEAAAGSNGQLSVKLAAMIQDFKLTGISLDPEDPSRTFCMIEDIKKDMTTFLKKGDSIAGLSVMDITEDHVLLGSGDERIELR